MATFSIFFTATFLQSLCHILDSILLIIKKDQLDIYILIGLYPTLSDEDADDLVFDCFADFHILCTWLPLGPRLFCKLKQCKTQYNNVELKQKPKPKPKPKPKL